MLEQRLPDNCNALRMRKRHEPITVFVETVKLSLEWEMRLQ